MVLERAQVAERRGIAGYEQYACVAEPLPARCVAAHRHVGLTAGDDDGAARGRSAARVAEPERIVDGAGSIRVTAAGEAEVTRNALGQRRVFNER